VTTVTRSTDFAALRRDLIARADLLFRECWDEPRNPNAFRWRPRRRKPGDDPRRMVMQGPQRGVWYDSAREQGGDLFDFIAIERLGMASARIDFPRVVDEAVGWLGAAPVASCRPHHPEPVQSAPDIKFERDAVLAVLEPLSGRTLRYWTGTRGLDPPPDRVVMRLPPGALERRPEDSKLPFAEREAVVVLGRDLCGRVRAFQRILLVPGTVRRNLSLPKFALGPIGRFPPFFPSTHRNAAQGILVFAEGPETAAAIWSASGARVLVCGGGMARRIRELSRLATVIVAVEADAPNGAAARAPASAVARARANGARLALLHCGGEPGSGFDAADLIREEGGRERLGREIDRLAQRLQGRIRGACSACRQSRPDGTGMEKGKRLSWISSHILVFDLVEWR